jgi:glycyl-tRNA synthetase beta chain
MTAPRDLLIEIGVEELPPKLLKPMIEAFAEKLKQKLIAAQLACGEIKTFAAPRRLALLIQQVAPQQADREIERRGPALQAAYDAQGQPTPALQGFMRSLHISDPQQLQQLTTPQGSWLTYRYRESGKTLAALLPALINQTLLELPTTKPMHWPDSVHPFIRPIHWIVLLYGDTVIPAKVFDLIADRNTYGHRFHHPAAIALANAASYSASLKESGYVIADFHERKELIRTQIKTIAAQQNGQAIIDEALLEEVTGLVEWPQALLISFNADFLTVPREALIASMQGHQKCFPLENAHHQLLPYCVTISNIESTAPQAVIRGNERVMGARLADAKFFYETDCRKKLVANLEELKQVVFQAKSGSLYDKSLRIAELARIIINACGKANSADAYRAGLLCKADLLTQMVGEFPELQGIMGYYYAQHDGENATVAEAIRDHYRPGFANDKLPETILGCAVALADRLDTLTSNFSNGQIPTGDKDPFGFRRAALGVVRILLEKVLPLNLRALIHHAQTIYAQATPDAAVAQQLMTFIVERSRAWYSEKNIAADTLDAALAATYANNAVLLDVHYRVLALHEVRPQAYFAQLITANKRADNLLRKTNYTVDQDAVKKIQPNLFMHDAERALFATLKNHCGLHQTQSKEDYLTIFNKLTDLQMPLDNFFTDIMVMDEDEKIRNNRLALLAAVRVLFLQIADISLLPDKSSLNVNVTLNNNFILGK